MNDPRIAATPVSGLHGPAAERWRPIDKDTPPDTRMFLWCADLYGEEVWDEKVARKVRRPKGTVFGYVYISHGGAVAKGDGMNGDWTFTHWMPLPEGPQ